MKRKESFAELPWGTQGWSGSNLPHEYCVWCPAFLPRHCLVHLLMSGLWPWIISCNHHSFSRCWHTRQMYSLWEQLLLWEEKSWKHIPVAVWFNWGSKHRGNNGWHWPGSTIGRCTESQKNQGEVQKIRQNTWSSEGRRRGRECQEIKTHKQMDNASHRISKCVCVCVCVCVY